MPPTSKTIKTINDLAEVSSMLETRTKLWEEKILEKGIEKGIDMRDNAVILRLHKMGMELPFISKATGLSIEKINAILATKKK